MLDRTVSQAAGERDFPWDACGVSHWRSGRNLKKIYLCRDRRCGIVKYYVENCVEKDNYIYKY
jgi:hypothetical protein